MVSTLWGNQLRFRLKTDGITSTLSSNSGEIFPGIWYHIAAVYDGSEMRLYKNGAEVVPGIAKSGSIDNGDAGVTIGNQPADDKPFDGIIDDVCIFNQALTETEFVNIKDNGCESTRQPAVNTPPQNAVQTAPTQTIVRRINYSVNGQMIGVRVSGHPNPPNNGLFYAYTDHLGSVTALSDANGNYVSGSLGLHRPFGSYRVEPTTNPDITDHGYTGHRENLDVQLTYMNARYHLGEIGRFASPDSIVPDPMNPQALNRYTYGLNNPINFSDPTGHYAFEDDPSDPNIIYPDSENIPVRCSGSCYPDWNDENNTSPWWTPIAALYGPAMAYGFLPEIAMMMLPTATTATEVVCADGDCTNETSKIVEYARSLQGSGKYPGVDKFTETVLKKGDLVAGGLPKQSNFYTTLDSLKHAEGSAEVLWKGLQVAKHPEEGYRMTVGVYRVVTNTNAATGNALANTSYGDGGFTQFVIQNYQEVLELIYTINLQ